MPMKKVHFHELPAERFTGGRIFLDVDGTLVPDGSMDGPGPEVQEQIKRLQAARAKIFLCSNGTDKARARAIATRLGVTYHETNLRKPNPASVADIAPVAGEPAFVIGDKILTDGLLARALDIPFVHVAPLRSVKEPYSLRSIRAVDALCEKLLRQFVRTLSFDKSLTLLTAPPTPTLRYDRRLIRSMLQWKQRVSAGPEYSVCDMLAYGLTSIGTPFRRNPALAYVTDTVCVLEGASTLRWALEQKSRGYITTIIAGPSIVMAPTDEDNIIRDSRIDMVVLPSEWNKRWWMSFDQLFDSKARTWASGVLDRGAGGRADGPCVVYSKNADEKLFHTIIETLWTHKLPIVVSKYGEFTESEYLRLLTQARMVIYLSEYEQDGVSLRQAWMAGVPTLVWNRGYFMYHEKRFEDPSVGAPYLTPECGATFTGADDFKEALIQFLAHLSNFNPREHALAHYTPEIAARKYVGIVTANRL